MAIRLAGGRRSPVSGEAIVELRDHRHLLWADISAYAGIAVPTARRLYKAAGGDTTTRRRYLSTGLQAGTDPDQSTDQAGDQTAGRAVGRNRAYGHRAEIVAAWHSGETSTAGLAYRRGLGETIIRRWASEARRAEPGRYGPADRPRRDRPGPEPGAMPAPPEPVWTMGEDQQEPETASLSRLRRPGSPWCTQAEVAAILDVSRHQIPKLIFEFGVLSPGMPPAAVSCSAGPTSTPRPASSAPPIAPTAGLPRRP